jgi:hypothetical protein
MRIRIETKADPQHCYKQCFKVDFHRIWNLSWEPDSGAKKTTKEGDFEQFRNKMRKTTF